ncbi:MAG: DUF4126 domain-containing protein [Thermomicrobiales bacterium]
MSYPIITGICLAASAGLNAYLPLLVLALADRITDRVNLGTPYDFIASTWTILALIVLLTIELVADKIPGIDHANDLIQSVIRPAAGAFLMMAVINDNRSLNPVVGMIIGLLIAVAVHTIKALSRPHITMSTGGMGNPIVSLLEDAVSGLTSVLAILVPIAALILFTISGAFLFWSYRSVQRLSFGRSRTRPTTQP